MSDHLAGALPSVKKKIMCQYVSFFQNLSRSSSREVRILSGIVSNDIQSVTGRNLANIARLFQLNPRMDPASAFKVKDIGYMTPEEDQWRLPFLEKLLDQRREIWTCEEETSHVDELIESLCTS